MTNKIYNVLKDHRMTLDRTPPLWFTEGLAEYLSSDIDAQAEMVLRDAVINNYLVSLLDMYRIYGTFLMYKEGQSFLEFAGEKYGKQKILDLLENIWMDKSFKRVMEYTFGTTIENLDKDWQYFLKKKYYPLLATDVPQDRRALKITKEGFNFSPVCYKNGDNKLIYFVANRDGYSSLYSVPVSEDNKPLDSPSIVVRGEKSNEFEAFHLFQSAIDVSKDGLVAFVTKKGGTDVIHFYSVNDKEVIKDFQNDELINIISPKFSPSGNRVVFYSVDRKGYMDLFIYDLRDDKLLRLTNDYYDDRDPIFGVDDDQIIFTSDRTGGKYEKKYNLFSFDLNTYEISYVTYLGTNNYSPAISPDKNKLLFTSELDGVRNIWELDVNHNGFSKTIKRVSRFYTSAFSPAFSDTSSVLFAGFENFSINLYAINNFSTALDTTQKIEMDMASASGRWLAQVLKLPP